MKSDIFLKQLLKKNNITTCLVCKVEEFKIDHRGALVCKHGHESKVIIFFKKKFTIDFFDLKF